MLRDFTYLLVVCALCGACSEGVELGADLGVGASPSAVYFGALTIGDYKSEQVIITHTGTSGTVVLEPSSFSSPTSDLEVEGPYPLRLSVGEQATITVHYNPTDTVYDSGVIRVAHNVESEKDLFIEVSTVVQSPLLDTVPPTVDFGNVSAGSVSTMDLVAKNVGTAPTLIENIGLDLVFGAPFSITDAPQTPFVLKPGETVNVQIEFAPPLTGKDMLYNAQLRFVSDHEATNNRAVSVMGLSKHAMLTVTPSVLSFGWVSVDSVATLPLHLENKGNEKIVFESVALKSAHEDVSLLGVPADGAFELSPGELLTLTVRFEPKNPVSLPGGFLGEVDIISNDYVVPNRSVAIYGYGAEPAIGLIPETVSDFGIVGIGYMHKRTIKAVNYGAAPLSINSVGLSEDTPDSFRVLNSPELPVVLAPTGGVAEFVLSYTNPGLIDGEMWGELWIGSDDPVQPKVSLSLRARNAEVASCIPRFEPPLVKFGTVTAGSKLHRSFKLVNDGSLPCRYKNVVFVDCTEPEGLCSPVPGFSAVYSLGKNPPDTNKLLLFDDALDIPVWFDPIGESGEFSAMAVVTMINGAGDGPAIQHHSQFGGALPSLTGAVGTGGIVAKPGQLKYGLTTVGCGSEPTTVNVKRIGELPIQLSEINLVGCNGQIQVKDAPQLPYPLALSWDDALPLSVQFTPTDAGIVSCDMILTPDVADTGVATVSVSAVATLEKKRVELYSQSPESYVDILFVVDDSGSMKGEQEALVNGFQGFIDKASEWDVKYQIGVTSTDVEKGAGWLQGTLEYVNNINANVFKKSALLGTKGSGKESGLLTGWLALQPDMLVSDGKVCTFDAQCTGDATLPKKCVLGKCGGPNRGFIREHATLAIIWISDEDDQSPGDVEQYVKFFQDLKGPDRVKGYAIVGDPSTLENPLGGCGKKEGGGGGGAWGTGGQAAKAGNRYVEASEMTGGGWYSICDFGKPDLEQAPLLDQIGADAFKPVNEFALNQAAEPSTINVFVNDELCSEGWSYNVETKTVIFELESPCFPGASATVKIEYEPVCYPI